MAITIKDMTIREKVHKLVDELPEAQLGRLIEFLESQDQPGDVVDEWGNLSKLHRISSRETMQRLAEEERAATMEELATFEAEYGPFLPPDGEG
jgi:hypothetical protein